MRHSKSRKTNRIYPMVITAVIVTALAVSVFLFLSTNGASASAKIPLKNMNLNLSDIAEMFPNTTYLPSSINSVKNMSGPLYDEGYRYVSVSEFSAPSNFSYYSTYPDIITSVIYITSNKSVASNVTKDIIASSSPNQTNSTGTSYAGIVIIPYSFKNITRNIDTLYNVAVLNSSLLFRVSQYPVFQQTSVINYKDEIAVVTVNGYKNMSPNTSITIAKTLFKHMVS